MNLMAANENGVDFAILADYRTLSAVVSVLSAHQHSHFLWRMLRDALLLGPSSSA